MDYAELRGHADNSLAQEWSGVKPVSLPQFEDTCTAERRQSSGVIRGVVGAPSGASSAVRARVQFCGYTVAGSV